MRLQCVTEEVADAVSSLTVDELADFVDHLGEGSLESLREESWYHHIAHLVPEDSCAESIYTLWVILISIHEERYMAAR